MRVNVARSVASVIFLATGVTTLMLRKNGYFPEGFADIVLVVLMVGAVASYYVLGYRYKTPKATNNDSKTSRGDN